MRLIHRGFPHRPPQPAGRVSLTWGLAIVVLALLMASCMRLQQRAVWQTQAEQYQAGGVPMMTTLDAYYGLRLARQQAAGSFQPGALAPPRHFMRPPMGSPDSWVAQWEPRTLPLLSRLIAAAAAVSGLGIDRTALLLPPLLSSLFMLPLFVAFWRLGAPAAGLMGGLVGTFCLEYFGRTGVGWSDTDQLNLLFPWLLVALFLHMGSDLQRWRLLGWAALAGLVNQAYSQWYWKPGLALGLAVVLGLHLALAGAGWRRWAPAVALFVLCSGPGQYVYALASLADFGAHYLWAERAAAAQPLAALRFADVWATISEVRPLTPAQTLATVLPRAEWAALGGLVFLGWALRRWRSMAPLLPWMLLGGMALLSSRRFTLYLAPFIGAGWGLAVAWLVGLLVKPAAARAGSNEADPAGALGGRWPALRAALAHRESAAVAALVASALVFVVWLRPDADSLRAPAPAVAAPVYSDLKALAARLPADARLWTWWDLGFAIVDATGLGVYHDGAVQFTPQTHLVAVSLAHADPAVLHDVLRFVDQAGNPGIQAQAALAQDLPGLLARLRLAAPAQTTVPVVVTFTPDMLPKFASIQGLATPMPQDGQRPRPFGIVPLQCSSLSDDALRCDGVTVDLRSAQVKRTGLPSGEAAAPRPLRRLLVVEDGRVSREQSTGAGPGLTVQLVTDQGRVKAVFLLDEAAYASNLNQMYLLGRFDASRFEQVFHRPLGVRAFRVLPAAP